MRDFIAISKALSDPARLRVLLALRDRELCLCHFVALLELAPSTVSKHLDLLYQAGLVQRRREGRWRYFKRAAGDAPSAVLGAIEWVNASLCEDPQMRRDERRINELLSADVTELTCCYKGA